MAAAMVVDTGAADAAALIFTVTEADLAATEAADLAGAVIMAVAVGPSN
jgi:hypothetical protein